MKFKLLLILSIYLVNGQFIKSQVQTQCDSIEYLRPEIFYISGTAKIISEPTQATINLEIQVKSNTAQEALSQASEISEKAIESIKGLSKTELKIQTTDFQIQPFVDYDWSTGKQLIIEKGFLIKNQLSIETTTISQVGQIIDVAVQSGINQINGVNFDISQTEKKRIKDVLIEQAIEDAKHKATIVLKQLNLQIVSLKGVELLSQYQTYDIYQQNGLSQDVRVGFVVTSIDQ